MPRHKLQPKVTLQVKPVMIPNFPEHRWTWREGSLDAKHIPLFRLPERHCYMLSFALAEID